MKANWIATNITYNTTRRAEMIIGRNRLCHCWVHHWTVFNSGTDSSTKKSSIKNCTSYTAIPVQVWDKFCDATLIYHTSTWTDENFLLTFYKSKNKLQCTPWYVASHIYSYRQCISYVTLSSILDYSCHSCCYVLGLLVVFMIVYGPPILPSLPHLPYGVATETMNTIQSRWIKTTELI
jgi:hypothetical protein